ncbi:uncharacterized protein LOC110866783 [Helianthus annuus]|uniref:uncharacterized protein LOC110866783 n=1 Tax=Helianthus annuus TaxID=4232 RepID=UPI000B8FD05F|nr:uncharacterized protein LOC110866783 [Helianthus annuus]
MEALSCLIAKASVSGCFKGIVLPNGGPLVSHLFYAYDALILGEWEEDNFKAVARILRVFFPCSGLKINFNKSNLYGVGTEDADVVQMASIVGCERGSSPFTYLGIQLGANMNRVRNWDPIFGIFKNRLASWKAHSLSIVGRVVLIKAVLESPPIYYFSIFKAPVKVVDKLESLMKNFLWGGSEEVRKTHWVAWEKVSRSKKDGELGLCKLKLVNEALLAKWVWRFKLEDNSLWKRVIMVCHGRKRRWSFLPSNPSVPGVWNNIRKMEEKLIVNGKRIHSLVKGVVGNGNNIRF